LDQLEIGDRIEVETAVGTHVFEIREIHIVEPDDVWVTEEKPGAWLTLTTCHPHFSARERLVVQAELVDGPHFESASLLARAQEGQDARGGYGKCFPGRHRSTRSSWACAPPWPSPSCSSCSNGPATCSTRAA